MCPGLALHPLLTRYAAWLEMNQAQVIADREEDPGQVRAIQIVLRLERARPPGWHAALAAAASGCAALCLDPRSEPGGDWYAPVRAYCRGHIRKVTRRGRGAPWRAISDLPGLTVTSGGTQVRVLVPGLVSELSKPVAKLQVGGTDVPPDAGPVTVTCGGRAGGDSPVLVVHVPEALTMSTGKLMAQAGHVGMLTAALLAGSDQAALARWRAAGCPSRVLRTEPGAWADLGAAVSDPRPAWDRHRLVPVRDAGFTEVAPGTVTVIGQLTG